MIYSMLKYNNMNLKLIIGLGNPGPKYQNTYHNVGHLFVDWLRGVQDAGNDRVDRDEQFDQSAGWRRSITSNIELLQSNTHMNNSGKFVAKELKKAGAKPEELLIVHDDSDLALGNYKLQFGRGAAGHHGVENVQAALKTKDFWRLRIGIRPANEKVRQRAEKFVLKKISSDDRKILEAVFGKMVTEIDKPRH